MKMNAIQTEPDLESLSFLRKPFSSDFLPDDEAKGKSHFQFAFYFVRRKRRKALQRLYAYCRLLDDISDSSGLTAEEREASLSAIENWVRQPRELKHLYWDTLKKDILDFHLSTQALLGIIHGVRFDLHPTPIKTWKELEHYCYGVACCVGECVLSILGLHGEQARDYALAMGKCLQFLNIMRDLEEDAKIGRRYVPEECLHQLSIKNALSLTPQEKERIREVLYKKAMVFRSQAKPFAWSCLSAELMAAIYLYGSKRYWRWGNKHRLSKFEKFSAASTGMFRFTLGFIK